LKSKWQEEYNTWRRRDLSGKHYIYWWVDGVYLNTPIKERTCVLLIIGATAEGEKELLALEDGYRESEQSWIEYSGSESQRFRKRTIMCSGRWSYGILESVHPGIW